MKKLFLFFLLSLVSSLCFAHECSMHEILFFLNSSAYSDLPNDFSKNHRYMCTFYFYDSPLIDPKNLDALQVSCQIKANVPDWDPNLYVPVTISCTDLQTAMNKKLPLHMCGGKKLVLGPCK